MNPVDAYFQTFPPEVKDRLQRIRELCFALAPAAGESIRYHMAAFEVGAQHLYVAGYKNHIGLYAVYSGSELEEEIAAWRAKGTRDTLHFPHKHPLPMDLIRKIILAKIQPPA